MEPFYLEVDFKHGTYINKPRVTQNDKVTFILSITDDGLPYSLTGIDTVTLASFRADGQSVLTVGDKTGENEVTFDLGTNALGVIGTTKASIQLYSEEGRVSSIPFIYEVLKDLTGEYIPSEDEQSLIELVLYEGPIVIKEAKDATKAVNDKLIILDNRLLEDWTGPQGLKGDKGDKGDTGATGATGPIGPTGLKGDKGDTGAKGDQGIQGVKGDTGPIGPTGLTGAKGDQGIQGVKGDTGTAGTSFVVDATGTLANKSAHDTKPSGFAYLATDTGNLYIRQGTTGWSAAIAFGKGDKGDTGSQGPIGLTGATGPIGLTGPKGDKGDTGATGKDGIGKVSSVNNIQPDTLGNVSIPELGELKEVNRLTSTLTSGTSIVEGKVDAIAEVEFEGNTLTSLGNSNLEASKKYVVADKKTKVVVKDSTNYEGTTVSGVGKFVKGSDKVASANFVGKVAGSTVANPHIGYGRHVQQGLILPTDPNKFELDGIRYTPLSKLDGSLSTLGIATYINGNIGQQLYAFDVIAEIERKLGLIPRTTLADKVSWVKENVEKFTWSWDGFGISVGGNKASLSSWNGTTWVGVVSHTNATVSKLSNGTTDVISRVQSDGFVYLLAYAEPSDGVIASTINPDYVELVVTLKAMAQLNTRPKVIRVENFEGKVSGDVVGNPHVAKRIGNQTTLQAPTGTWVEFDNAYNTPITTLNGLSSSQTSTTNLGIAQQLFSFNLIEAVERNIGRIPRTSVADKVAWLKANVGRLSGIWRGFGSSVGGNRATLRPFNSSTGNYSPTLSHSQGVVTMLNRTYTGVDATAIIGDDGFVHYIVYAEPSDGTTPSVINTDYIELEFELKETADFTQPKVALYEATEDAYTKILVDWNADDVVNRYPIVEGTQHLQGVGVVAEGENLLPPFTEWTLHANAKVVSPYEIEVTSASAATQVSIVNIPLLPNQPYNIKIDNAISAGFSLKLELNKLDGTKSVLKDNTTMSHAFTSPSDSVSLVVMIYTFAPGVFVAKNPMLTPGSVAKPFVPRNPSYLFADVKLGAIGNVRDTLYEQDGRWLLRKAVEKDVVLDGSLGWFFNEDAIGYKRFQIPFNGQNVLHNNVFSKYNGKALLYRASIGQVVSDDIAYMSTVSIVLSINDIDTGFGESLVPTASDIKRYFNGWKYTDGTTWTSVTGNGQTATAQVALDTKPTDYTPYKLSYVLATPQVIDVTDKVEGSLKVNGVTQVEVTSGLVRREKVAPMIDSGNYYISSNNKPSYWNTSKTKFSFNLALSVYKNGVKDSLWKNTNGFVYVTKADFDPKAEYTVTYLVSDKAKLTTNATNVKMTYGVNLSSVVSDLVTQVDDNTRDISQQEYVHDYIEAKTDNNRLDLDTHKDNPGIHVTPAEKLLIAKVPDSLSKYGGEIIGDFLYPDTREAVFGVGSAEGTLHGFFFNKNGLGIYDWKNARSVFNYNAINNLINITVGSLKINGKETSVEGHTHFTEDIIDDVQGHPLSDTLEQISRHIEGADFDANENTTGHVRLTNDVNKVGDGYAISPTGVKNALASHNSGEKWVLLSDKTMAVLGDFWYSTYLPFTPYKKIKFILKSLSGHYQNQAVTATQLQLQFSSTTPTYKTYGHRYMRMTGAVSNPVVTTLRDLIPLLSSNMLASTAYPHHEVNATMILEKVNYKDNNNSGFLPYAMEFTSDIYVRNPNGAAQEAMLERQELVFPLAINQNFPEGITLSNSRTGGFTKGTIEIWGVME